MRARIAVAVVAAALALGACGGHDAHVADDTTTTTAAPATRCTADGIDVPGGRPGADVPAAVVKTWEALRAAVLACDYGAIDEIAAKGDGVVRYTFGEQSPDVTVGEDLRAREGRDLRIMAILAQTLGLPEVKVDGIWAWPSAYGPSPSDADWQALEAVYPPSQVALWRQQGGVYYGYRVGIADDGDWQYFVAGD